MVPSTPDDCSTTDHTVILDSLLNSSDGAVACIAREFDSGIDTGESIDVEVEVGAYLSLEVDADGGGEAVLAVCGLGLGQRETMAAIADLFSALWRECLPGLSG